MADRARKKTDEILNQMEKQIGRVYKLHPALLQAKKNFEAYMKMVKEKTEKEYNDYTREKDLDKKEELKKIYSEKVELLTLKSKTFRRVQNQFIRALTQANQSSLNIANKQMAEIYMINYNQISNDCKKIGIKVNGEK